MQADMAGIGSTCATYDCSRIALAMLSRLSTNLWSVARRQSDWCTDALLMVSAA